MEKAQRDVERCVGRRTTGVWRSERDGRVRTRDRHEWRVIDRSMGRR